MTVEIMGFTGTTAGGVELQSQGSAKPEFSIWAIAMKEGCKY